tara:strand:- start:295 stop:471 length:177 start_codon:yes stop_codon:yes gene_type:complete
MVPLMLLSGHWIQRKPGLTGIEVMAGVGKRLLEFVELVQLLQGGCLLIKVLGKKKPPF